MRLPARRDTRFAGGAGLTPQEWWSTHLSDKYMTPGRPFDTQTFALDTHMLPQNVLDFAARYPDTVRQTSLQDRYVTPGITPEGSWDGPRNFSGDGASGYYAMQDSSYNPGYREGYVGKGQYGTVWEDEPGLVRKEINTRKNNQSDNDIKEELDNQIFMAELGMAPRVAAYDTAVNGDPLVKAITMQDTRTNYEPVADPIIGNEHIDNLGDPGTSKKYRRFAMDHQKQMGHLALKGFKIGDRHTGNIMRHKGTGRPLQVDFGYAGKIEGEDKFSALLAATTEGFKASGQPDVAEIVYETAYDMYNGGDLKQAWDFTKEAFANLQKTPGPLF